MKFFTREWCEGKLSKDMTNEMWKKYDQYLQKIQPKFSNMLKKATKQFNLHDGLIKEFSIDEAGKNLNFKIVCGDLQVGYSKLNVSYNKVEFSKTPTKKIEQIANNPETEILYDEYDISGDLYIHRIIVWPRYESFSIYFKDLNFKTNKVKSRN